MHNAGIRVDAARLHAEGLSDAEVARRLGLARTTVRDWRRAGATPPRCPRCWRRARAMAFTSSDYSELLGLYLGDGCISVAGRTERLRLSLDAKYPGIVAECRALLARCFTANRISAAKADDGSTVVLSVYSSHLTCLFPQAGPGKKHERPIVLEPWQRAAIEAFPWAFIRGCIRSDGCCFINRTGPYQYLTYDFCNLSADIRGHFMSACDAAGVAYRARGERVRINRRSSVSALHEHVGLKR